MPARRVLAGFLAVFAVVLIAGAAELLVLFPQRPAPGPGEAREILVPPGIGPRELSFRLAESSLTANPLRFSWWLRLTRRMPSIRAGRFVLADDLSPEQIVDQLGRGGGAPRIRITIPEGFHLTRIGAAFEKAGVVNAVEFVAAAGDRTLLEQLKISGTSAEGYLFPDTYFFKKDQAASEVIAAMHKNFRSRLSDGKWQATPELHQVVILASIVQAEAALVEEMPTIAGVYHNRLTRPEFPSRLLQADPTVSYGCQPFIRPLAPSCTRFVGVLTRQQLDDRINPYNTYRHPGLPPGPICSPGWAALQAARSPADVPFFYFVAASGGRHVFSVTLDDHQRAVRASRANETRLDSDPPGNPHLAQ